MVYTEMATSFLVWNHELIELHELKSRFKSHFKCDLNSINSWTTKKIA